MPCSAAATEPGRGPAVLRLPPQRHTRLQRWRRALQAAFFALFLLAPALDLLRFDLMETQLWVLGQRWSLGIDAFLSGQATANETAIAITVRGILPAVALVLGFLAIARRWGRLYCGWLCPHFSLVELLNDALHRATGRYSLWDREPTARSGRQPQRAWWAAYTALALGFGFLWALTALTYLLPPAEVWGNLWRGTLTGNQARFIGIGTLLIGAELLLARHLFCRFGCAIGFFQSLAWMSNPKALVMAFDRQRAAQCRSCGTADAPDGDACEAACPMRLQPRRAKRWMFACVQCGRCTRACANSHALRPAGTPGAGTPPNLHWTVGLDALRETLRQRGPALAHPSPPSPLEREHGSLDR